MSILFAFLQGGLVGGLASAAGFGILGITVCSALTTLFLFGFAYFLD